MAKKKTLEQFDNFLERIISRGENYSLEFWCEFLLGAGYPHSKRTVYLAVARMRYLVDVKRERAERKKEQNARRVQRFYAYLDEHHGIKL